MKSFERVDRLIVGTIGAPGEREFYLQVESESLILSFAIEKAQAAALATRMKDILREIRNREGGRWEIPAPDDAPLKLPVETEFIVAQMSLVWDSTNQKILLEAMSERDDAIQINITLSQAAEFVRRTERVVSAGRNPCQFCGLPLNLDGHLCPRANGYRR